ncbi:DUF2637 domain-containing protein [Glaciibacter superstes]|uniref:DUF2637 domain-containing protein n=1 Tax=Glaciibacter superstes TaxID=501023 RepID=UPI0003B68A71|nr:DUF2637 domain-containing protein [Glaciibacter superstes]
MNPAPVDLVRRRGGRLAVVTAVAGTVFIAAGAFWLSFTALADLAHRSGVSASQAWAWPLIVDGIIVVATVAVVALAAQKSAWYPWLLLGAGAVVSVTANALHAVVSADADVPPILAASVAAVPPLVLLAITHLTVILTRPLHLEPVELSPETESDGVTDADAAELVVARPVGRELAVALRGDGWSNKQIAWQVGVHPSTIGRWFHTPALPSTDDKETP